MDLEINAQIEKATDGLPTGLQVFEKIRKKGLLYVDKTDMIYEMVSGGREQFFISRPRRFGKTLLCWTLNALFSGKRELFEGLAISKTDWAWDSYPVIHLDMSKVATSAGVDGVRMSLISQMKDVAVEHGVDLCDEILPGDMLKRIVIDTSKKHGKPAVVLIDEYDSPFLGFFNDPPIAEKVRDIMRDVYTQLKANEQHIRFLFLTGISKFTKAGVFSKLNNLNDLSMDKKFGAMLGYTDVELRKYFDAYLKKAATAHNMPMDELLEKIKYRYNGFCFDGLQKVYSPYSILKFFQSYEFLNFWMKSGSTKLIADYMKGRHLTVEQFRGKSVSVDFAHDPGEIDSAPPESFFYQAGYLTLLERDGDSFTLDCPNAEVLESMSALVCQNMIEPDENFMDLRGALLTALKDKDCEYIVETFNRLFVGIPYNDYDNAAKQGIRLKRLKISTQEWLYRTAILSFLRGVGTLTFGETHNNMGRSDLTIFYQNTVWIIEIKVAANADEIDTKVEEGVKQINDRQYGDPYKNAKKLAIAIDDSIRQIGKWIEA